MPLNSRQDGSSLVDALIDAIVNATVGSVESVVASTTESLAQHRKLLFLLIGASAMIFCNGRQLKAFAQTAPAVTRLSERSLPQPQPQATLWVNPQTGNDRADGSEQTPFRTLTHALQVARAHTVIQLAAGTYSTDNGEVFPLALKQNVTIQGSIDELGQGVVIRGGGSYDSPTAGNQNVSLVSLGQATVQGVTVTNPISRGHGLWIEAGNPTIQNNTFIGNMNTGMVISGSSTPTVSNNLFLLNRAGGMMVVGNAQPEVRANVFQRTGAGLTIDEHAAPQVIGNRISQNRNGIVVQGNAHPILRSNLIEDSDRNGLVVIAQAQPNLGTAQDPGQNQFFNNRQHDIDALATSQTLPAFGNQIASDQIAGEIDLTGNAPLVSVTTVASAANRLPATQVSHSIQLVSAAPISTPPSAPLISNLPPQALAARTSAHSSGSSITSRPTSSSATPVNQSAGMSNMRTTGSSGASSGAAAPVNIAVNPPIGSASSANRASGQASSSGSAASGSAAPRSAASGSMALIQPSQLRQPVFTSSLATENSSNRSARPTTSAEAIPIPVPAPAQRAAAIEINVPPPENMSRQSSPMAMALRTQPASIASLPASTTTANRSAAAATTAPQPIQLNVPPPERIGQPAQPAQAVAANSTNLNATVNPVTPVEPQTSVMVTAAASLPRQNFSAGVTAPSISGSPINIPVPPPEQMSSARSNSASSGDSTSNSGSIRLIPVPADEIPVGNTEGMTRINVANALSGLAMPSNLRYRVVVRADNSQSQSLVQSLVPEAFVTSINGQTVMQIGAFSSQSNAQQAVELLSQNGIRGIIQPIE